MTLVSRIKTVIDRQPSAILSYSKKQGATQFSTRTYGEFWEECKELAAGLNKLGVVRGSHIGIISDNRREWLPLDMAILGLGAVDVPRGSDSTAEEIAFILEHGDCTLAIIENEQLLRKLIPHKDKLAKIQQFILIEDSEETLKDLPKEWKPIFFSDILESGKKLLPENPDFFIQEVEKGNADDLATIIYTSGTTGEPKGVMLTHTSFLFQIDKIYNHLDLKAGEVFITVLPIWHSFERAVEYIVLERGMSIVYSRPIGSIMLADMKQTKPHWMTSVPRIWESIMDSVYRKIKSGSALKRTLFNTFVSIGGAHAKLYNRFRGMEPDFIPRIPILDKIITIIPLILLTPFKLLGDVLVFKALKALLGGRFRCGVSGGGALPAHVDYFFQAAGIKIVEGYGLTETGPVLSVRKSWAPTSATVGPLLEGIEYKLVDEHGKLLGPGQKGELHVKSPQIMQGYYKRPDETKKVISEDGYINTGDLAVFTHSGPFKIIGRSKETIVLLGGENIEPTPIEDALRKSVFIKQVMVVGQDKKFLGALIVPDFEEIKQLAEEERLQYVEVEELTDNPTVIEAVNKDIQKLVSAQTGFKAFERINRFRLLEKDFVVGKELTPSLKIKRNAVSDLYAKQIAKIFTV